MFGLPNHIEMRIFEYDNTYHICYKKVLKQLITNFHTWHDWYKYVERRESIRLLEDRISIKK